MRKQLLKQLLDLYKKLLDYYLYNMEQTEAGKKIYQFCEDNLGKDITPQDRVSDVYACAEVVNEIVRINTDNPIGGGASTYLMYGALHQERFLKVEKPLLGDICISPSGYSSKNFKHGHVGIVGNGRIFSNNSENGKLENIYTFEMWQKVYRDTMGFPIYYFRVLF